VVAKAKSEKPIINFLITLSKKDIIMSTSSKVMAATATTAAATTVAKKATVENYSPEVTAKIVEAYAGGKGKTVAELATMFGKKDKSIIAKLSREKVYAKQSYTTKAGTKPEAKEEIVSVIAAFIGVAVDKLETLEKANKNVLVLLRDAVTQNAKDFANNSEFAEAEEARKDYENDEIARLKAITK